MIVVGGNTWKILLGHRRVTLLVTVAHHTYALAKGGRKSVQDSHSWIEPFCKSLIVTLRLTQFSGFRFKYGEDDFDRSAAIYFSSEWVCGQVFSGLLLILFQGFFEDWLEG
jgi:hypothetical protein